MSLKLKKKEVMESFKAVVSAGYCDLQNLLWGRDRLGYTAGAYGWNADVYLIDNVALVTGYRTFGNRISYETLKKYETKAEKLKERNRAKGIRAEQTIKALNRLLKKMIAEVTVC